MGSACCCQKPDPSRVNKIIDKHIQKQGALMPVLQDLQKELGWLSPEVLTIVAQRFKVPPSKVYGVASFYTLFSTTPKGRHIIRVCENAPCHVVGASAIIKELERQLGVKVGETTPDCLFTLELTSCLGVCGVAPVIDIDGEVYGNLKPSDIASILDKYRVACEALPKEAGQ